MPKVSVIMPVYNSEKFFDYSIYSVLTQTLKDIEVIIIDDGSTDSTSQICDKYASIDNRIKVIQNKNSGMGVSYNKGIELASGEYIGFVESDDKINKNFYYDLYELAQKHNNPDIVKSEWYNWNSRQNEYFKDMQLANYNSYEKIHITDYPNLLNVQFTVWSGIYRTDFIKEKNIKYLETPGASYQDVGYTYKAFCLSSSIVITPNAYYYYRIDNENSSINSKEKVNVIFGEYKEVDKFFETHPEIKEWANTEKLLKQFYDYIWNYNRVADKYKPDFLKQFACDFKRYQQLGELTSDFYSNIERSQLELILYMA